MMKSSRNFGRKALFVAISAMALSAGGNVFAGTAGDNLAVSATVIDNCLISTEALAFGNYDPVDANKGDALEGTGTVSITCTLDAAAAITLGQGANADTGSTDAAPLRRMTDGTNFLSYALYSDGGHAAVWGNDATVDVQDDGTGLEEDHTVYGLVAADQNVPAGAYSDTVVATVTF